MLHTGEPRACPSYNTESLYQRFDLFYSEVDSQPTELGNLVPVASQLVGEENPVNGDREGIFCTSLHADLDYLPALASAVNEGPLLGNRFVTVHVEIALFSGRIAVVPEYYLLGDSLCSFRMIGDTR